MRRAQIPSLSFPILSQWKERCQKRPYRLGASPLLHLCRLLMILFFKVCIGRKRVWWESQELHWALRYWACVLQESLLATVFAKKNLLEWLFQGSQLLSCAFCVYGPFPVPLTDAWIRFFQPCFLFPFAFLRGSPSLWLLLFLTPFPQLLNYTAPIGTYTIKNSSAPAASRSASPGAAERLAPGTGRALGSLGAGTVPWSRLSGRQNSSPEICRIRHPVPGVLLRWCLCFGAMMERGKPLPVTSESGASYCSSCCSRMSEWRTEPREPLSPSRSSPLTISGEVNREQMQ